MKKYSNTFFAAGLALSWIANSTAANLVPNGNFESGNSGFISDYAVVPPASLLAPSTYVVGTDPNDFHPAFGSYGDHTSGAGNMMVVNGSEDITDIVWETAAQIDVTPNTVYYFEAWMSSAHPTSPALLSFKLDGDADALDTVLGTGAAPATVGLWQPISFAWNSGANEFVTLYLENANSAFQGNDFAIDDIHFGERSSVRTPDGSSTLVCAGIGFGLCLLGNRRFGRASA